VRLPLSPSAASASPHETRLVGATLDARFLADFSELLIGDPGTIVMLWIGTCS
jgi:hypothetical protein